MADLKRAWELELRNGSRICAKRMRGCGGAGGAATSAGFARFRLPVLRQRSSRSSRNRLQFRRSDATLLFERNLKVMDVDLRRPDRLRNAPNRHSVDAAIETASGVSRGYITALIR